MPQALTRIQLWNALDGLMAYDMGAIDSGVHDEALRQRVIEHLQSLDEDGLRLTLSRFVRDTFLSEKALVHKYGIEDVSHFIQWLDERMGIAL